METFLLVVHIVASILIIAVVMLQTGKGDIGSAFGAGSSSGSVLGAAGAGNILVKITTWAAVVFGVTSLSIAVYQYRSDHSSVAGGIMKEKPLAKEAPVPSSPAVVPEDKAKEDKK